MFGAGFEDLFAGLDPDRGTAVVTEGLLNYFPTDRVEVLWTRVARELARFPSGLYLSDLHLAGGAALVDRAFAAGLGGARPRPGALPLRRRGSGRGSAAAQRLPVGDPAPSRGSTPTSCPG